MIIHKVRHIVSLLVVYCILLLGGTLLISHIGFNINPGKYVTLLSLMTLITLLAYLLIITGIKRGEKEQGIFLLAGLGGKFLAYLIVILIFWVSAKNLSKEFIIVFFVLYLVLTFFLLGVLYKLLKTN